MLLAGWQEFAAATCQPDHIRNALPGPLRPEIPNRFDLSAEDDDRSGAVGVVRRVDARSGF